MNNLRRGLDKSSAVIVLVGFFLVWEVGVRAFGTPAYILPAPSAILGERLSVAT